MKNLKRSLVSLLLVLILVVSSVVPSFAATAQPSSYSKTSNSGQRQVVCTTLDGTSADSYYQGSYEYDLLSEQTADQIKSALSTLMRQTHDKITTYNDCRDYVFQVDCENNNTSRATTLYTSHQMQSSEWAGTWSCNREHVWPQSLGGGNTSGGGADLHHIRPAEASVNSSRGNKKFGNYIPEDHVKGDVARICLYVYVRWGSDWGATNITSVFTSIDLLLEWCYLDPVDTWEMGRNEVVENIQGNRNVFIDYPEYAWLIFGRDVPEGLVSPSGEGADGTTSGGSGTTTCQHTSKEIRNSKDATCTATGYTGDTYCKSCGAKIATGTTLAKLNHNWSEWTINEAEGTKTHYCTYNCGTTQTVTHVPNCTHTETEIRDAVNATCSSTGYTGDTYCKICSDKLSSGQAVPATGKHTWGDTEITVQPEAGKDGEGVDTCTVCGTTVTVVIPGLPESFGASYSTDCEKIVAILSKNALYSYIVSLLTRS